MTVIKLWAVQDCQGLCYHGYQTVSIFRFKIFKCACMRAYAPSVVREGASLLVYSRGEVAREMATWGGPG